MDKHSQLLELAQKRKRSRCSDYKNDYKYIGDYHGGVYECDFVSPYTKSAYNFDSDIMIILQDWDSDAGLNKQSDQVIQAVMKFGYTPSKKTNINLKSLLKAHFGYELEDIYATNLFPFIKLVADIPPGDYVRAAREFALPQIKIVRPKLVVCLGLDTFNAIRCADNELLKPLKPLELAIESPFKVDGSWIWCQAHPAGRPVNRSKEQIFADWKRMKNAISP